MDYYSGTDARRRAENATFVRAPIEIRTRPLDPSREGPLPIDDSDDGCDDDSINTGDHPWTRQHAAIRIAHTTDFISDSGQEIFNVFAAKGICNIFIVGVHTNMCVLFRPFAIRQQVLLGKSIVLVRNLTDSLYNSAMPPYVSHDEGTAFVVGHIEKYWCPSASSSEIVQVISG